MTGKQGDIKRLPRVEFPAGVRRDTIAVREGLPRTQWGENSEALFLTSSFVHPDAATAAARFANEEEAFVYSRFSNPTVTMFERRLAALEKTEAALATSTGMSAILLLIIGLLKAGDHVICSRSVFGATIKLLQAEFGRFGVETTFVSQTDVTEWRAAMRPNTRLLFAETPSNPLTEICDIRALADIAHDGGALLAVDNCFCSPALQRPVEFGADLVVQEAQSARSLALARWLQEQPAVTRVYYPGLPSHPQHALAMTQQGGCGGAVVSFVTIGDMPEDARRNAFAVIDSTRICSISANLGDTKTIITHPASTSHGRLSEEQRLAAGITQGLVRIATGLEDVEDIKNDLNTGLAALTR
jgi:O-succinylhomoserine sulfhydrylase